MTTYKHIMRFKRKGMLGPRYINLYKIVDGVGIVAYRLMLFMSMNYIHKIFHVVLLPKYIRDPSYVLWIDKIELSDNWSYQESTYPR